MTVTVDFHASDYGIPGETIRIVPYDGTAAPGSPFESSNHVRQTWVLPAKSAIAWEIK